MSEQALPLAAFYEGWGTYQQGLVEVVAPLTAERLTLPAASHQWTIGMLIQHIVANRVWWFQVWMGEGSPDLGPIAHWDPSDEGATPVLSAAELVAGLEATWSMIEDALERWTAAELGQVFQPPSALRKDERENYPPRTLRWIVWHTLEHEIHHGGELSVALGAYGLPGIYAGM